MTSSYIRVIYFTACLLLTIIGAFNIESISDNILGAFLIIMPLSALYLWNKTSSSTTLLHNINIAMPIMNKYSITAQKSISVIVGAQNSGKSSILKNNGYSPIPENKLSGASVGEWWQAENDMFFEVDLDDNFKPNFITEDDNCWETLLRKLQKQLLPYNSIKNFIIVLPINMLHKSHDTPFKTYMSDAKELLLTLQHSFPNTQLNIVFSHCESIQGFQSFFYDLGANSKSQLLTVTKANNEDKLSLANLFTTKFTNIIETLQQQMFTRLRQEHDLARKIEIKDFPLQLEALITPIKELLMLIELVSPNQTKGIYFCSNYSGKNTYDFVQHSNPISTAKQQIVLLSNKEGHNCYFNSNIITNINATINTNTYNKREIFTISMLSVFSIASIILFKQSYDNYNVTSNITNQVESMIAIKANNNNSEIDRLYLALKYLSDNQNTSNSNSQTESLRKHLQEHYQKQLKATLSKEITNKINEFFTTKLESNSNLFPQYINTKLIFINEPITKKREWIQQLLNNSSHHQYLAQHIENLFQTATSFITFPPSVETKIAKKLYKFSTAEKAMMLVNKPFNKNNMHLGFPNEAILSDKYLQDIIVAQIPVACNKLILSKELTGSTQEQCVHASIKHYLLDYMNMWQYQNSTPQIERYDSLAKLNETLSSWLKTRSSLEQNVAKIKIVIDTLAKYNDPKLIATIKAYQHNLDAVSSWTKLLSNKELNDTLSGIIKLKPDYENYYTATVQYYTKSKLSQIIKLEQIAEKQAPEKRALLKNIASQTLSFYEKQAYTYLDNIWQQTVYNIYQKKIANKFPIKSNSNTEMSISDFEQFFSTDGIFQTYLSLVEPIINSSIISSDNRKAFLLGRKIANSWFVNNKLAVKLTMIPIDLTTNANNFYLEVGNNKLTFDKDNLKSTTINWPSNGDDLVAMEFTNKTGQSTIMNKNSAWALFKVLQEAEINPMLSKNQAYITFKHDAFAAKYQAITQDWFNLKDLSQITHFSISEHL